MTGKFAAFHISGGTTELVRVSAGEHDFVTELVGGSADLNAGQVIDRIGVHLGLPFPAGAHIEKLALMNRDRIPKRKVSANGTYVNLSGLENLAKKLYEDTKNAPLCASFVLDYVSRSIACMIDAYYEKYGEVPVLCAGGVMSNSIIKHNLSQKYDVIFAEPSLSTDNAVGIAALTRRAYESENKG